MSGRDDPAELALMLLDWLDNPDLVRRPMPASFYAMASALRRAARVEAAAREVLAAQEAVLDYDDERSTSPLYALERLRKADRALRAALDEEE